MSARSSMTMRAVVERDQASGRSPYNTPAKPDWQVLHTALPCRLWVHLTNEVPEDHRAARVEDVRCIVPLKSDIRRGDRIVRVEDRRGQVLFVGPFDVEDSIRRPDHLELLLRRLA